MKSAFDRGVTLVELAIVIVIIGLLISGVLVGEQLIKQAEISSDISNINSYKAASETFRLKYNGLPGDIRNAETYWPDCTEVDSASTVYGKDVDCNGDGNGIWNIAEGSVAFYHLSRAELVKGNYYPDMQVVTVTPSLKTMPSHIIFPMTLGLPDTGDGPTIAGVYYYNYPTHVNSFVVENMRSNHDSLIVDPELVYAFDTKMDDGKADKGALRTYYYTAGDTSLYCADADGDYRIGSKRACHFVLKY